MSIDHHRTLSVSELFPAVGAPIFISCPVHHGSMFLHDHEFIEIAMIKSGRGMHRTVHGTVPVEAGDVVLVLPGQWHSWENASEMPIYNIDFSTAMLSNELAWIASDPLSTSANPGIS